MKDCKTFIRGTIRFEGFCSIVSAYHDLGLSSDDPIPQECSTLLKILKSRIEKSPVQQFNKDCTAIASLIESVSSIHTGEPSAEHRELFKSLLERVDFKYLIKESSKDEV